MHTKREIVCTGLPEAMLIKNTALTKTRMAPSRTALPGIRPVQVLSNLSRRADGLNGAIPILAPKSGQNLGRRPILELKCVYTGCHYICTNLKMGKKKGAMEMAARTASKDARAHTSRRLMSQKSDEEDEDDQESEEAEEGSPSNSEIEKSASQSKRTAELRKQLEAEERTQKQLEERIADLRRKNRKSNAAFAQLQDSQFNGDGDNEEVHTPKTQIKRRKRSMRDDQDEDQKVILCREEWRTLASCLLIGLCAEPARLLGTQGCEHCSSKEYRSVVDDNVGY